MQPAVRFNIDEVVDLPPQVFITKEAQLSKEQLDAYRSMMNKLKAEYEGGEITASNEAVKASKLNQIALGVAYDENGNPVSLPSGSRLEVLLETIEASEGKSIVFVPFTGALNTVKEFLIKQGLTTEVVDGSVSKTERDRIFGLFQKTDDPKVLVANPAAMSHGLTLTAATNIIWYGAIHSNEIYQQACARVRRPGQKRTSVIVHIVSTKYEEIIYERLRNKQNLQGSLLTLMENEREGNLKSNHV